MTQFAVRRTPKPDDRILTNATHPFDPQRSDDLFLINSRLQIRYLPFALVLRKFDASTADRFFQCRSYSCNRLIAGLQGCFGLRDINANHHWLLRWRPDYRDDRA